ncbi:hypothetical protein [Bogoriella caseilytica]|uniref:Uncharacterized protein n=1 Tax=Bogoriella caseilytica TaxID=56055 RepID=A0A3N2BEX0_9MICO|nr:hypothetical protein [Bogoriella caseilytica]ROR73799.1 hypothetical protein EDD31_2188 [Bogoriella caseilytica]
MTSRRRVGRCGRTALKLLLPLAFALGSAAFTYATNPFTRHSVVKKTFRAEFTERGLVVSDRTAGLQLRQSLPYRALAVYATGLNILATRYVASPRSTARDIEGIVADIHALRFDPQGLLLISGDHFSALFVRNLGVFYYPMLDRSLPGAGPDLAQDWRDRQLVYLQTLGHALGWAAQARELHTTVVTTGRRTVTGVNFYHRPSDTLYGMLYALAALLGQEPARPAHYAEDVHALETVEAAQHLLRRYGPALRRHYADYLSGVLDHEGLLVRRDIRLSGAKDITERRSAFFDNVICWKTQQLGMSLGLVPEDQAALSGMKRAILSTFWEDRSGHFLEDLSTEADEGSYYSSDWLIVLATGFLNPEDAAERPYYERCVEYIRSIGVAEPLPLRYHADRRAHRQVPVVRLAVASYGGDAVWSFWGMEYIKTLILLHRSTGEAHYLDEAGRHLAAYEDAMLAHGGFPEVLDSRVELLTTPLYRSIRQTGWVIGFEQAREMYRAEVARPGQVKIPALAQAQ